MDDEQLIARAERALTEIKVASGLSEDHAAVLAALRIRLRGEDVGSLDGMLAAADDTPTRSLDDAFAQVEEAPKKPTLDDLLGGRSD